MLASDNLQIPDRVRVNQEWENMVIVLVDMDGVIADLEAPVVERIRAEHPEVPIVPLEKRSSFYMEADYPMLHTNFFRGILGEEGFYRNLPVMPGAQEAIQELLENNYVVKICTAPLNTPWCVKEKIEWIHEHFPELQQDIITSRDKTLIRGHVLIDDKDKITGVATPVWKHIKYKSGNRNDGTFTWANMQELYEWEESGRGTLPV